MLYAAGMSFWPQACGLKQWFPNFSEAVRIAEKDSNARLLSKYCKYKNYQYYALIAFIRIQCIRTS